MSAILLAVSAVTAFAALSCGLLAGVLIVRHRDLTPALATLVLAIALALFALITRVLA